jgi:hypothetical protein
MALTWINKESIKTKPKTIFIHGTYETCYNTHICQMELSANQETVNENELDL